MARIFDQNAEKAIPAEIHMISGSHDAQTSADVFNVGSFQLPDPAGRAGGACTSALLQVLYKTGTGTGPTDTNDMSWVDVLRRMRQNLQQMGYDQIPQLTSSRMIDVREPMHIVPPDSTAGTRRAVLIGINYVGQQGQLSGCHNDVKNVRQFLETRHGFSECNMTILMDDGRYPPPTRQNILNSFRNIVAESKAGDVVFIHYSGHGGRLRDDNGDEDDGYDETLIPVDFQRTGQIRDDDIYKILVKPMAAGVTCTCLMDCCHSGTVLDLPYRFVADGESNRMYRQEGFDFSALLGGALLGAVLFGDGDGGGDDACDCCECIMELIGALFEEQ